MTATATYRQLGVHYGRVVVRVFVWRRHWLRTLLVGMLLLYLMVSAAALGFLWREMVWLARPGTDPIAFLNGHLLTLFAGLFTVRFFLQRTPRMPIRPYLHLPVSRTRLVRFFQVSSLATVHNIFPILFFLPLWGRHLYAGPYPARAAWGWLAGIVLVLLLSHFLNTLLRGVLRRSREWFFIVAGYLLLGVFVDVLLGPGVLTLISTFIFDTLVAERPLILVLLAMLLGVVIRASSLQLHQNLWARDDDPVRGRVVFLHVPFRSRYAPLGNLLLLELKLMWRSERPKLYFLTSVAFAIIALAVPFLDVPYAGGSFARSFAGLFASGIFAFNYGQLMFAWESSYFDGLLARPVRLRDMVRAKLFLLQASCLGFYLLSLPVFIVLAPELLGLHTAFLGYNAGVSTLLVLMLALNNRKGVRLTRVGFFNFEGFSLLHWLWYIPMVIPPALVLFACRDVPPVGGLSVGTLVIASIGSVSLLLEHQWVDWFTRHLQATRHAMAAGFRTTL